MKKMLLPLIAVCCLAPAAVFAGQQHPLITDTAETVAPNKFEAETAVEHLSFDKATVFVLQETITGGIIPNLDAFITVPFLSVKADGISRESGLGDFVVGVKYNAAKMDRAEFAVKPFLVLPVGDDNKGLGYGGVGFGAVGIASVELSHQLAVDGNITLKHQETDGDSYNEFGASIAGKFAATKELKLVGELVLSNNDLDGAEGDVQATMTAGAIYAVQKNFEVDAGIRFGLTDEKEDFALLFGATFKF